MCSSDLAGAAKTGIPKVTPEGSQGCKDSSQCADGQECNGGACGGRTWDYSGLTSCVRGLKCGEVTKCDKDDDCGAPEACSHKDAKGNLDGLDCSNHGATGATCIASDPKAASGTCSRCDSNYSHTCFTCNGEFANEKSVTLTTDDTRKYQELIHTLDAVRKQGAIDLFTEINFARLAGQ